MALLQAQLPNYVDFPQHLTDGTYKYMPSEAPLTPANGVATDIYRERGAISGAPDPDIGVTLDKRAEKVIIQNCAAFPLKVRVCHNNDNVEAGNYHFILAPDSALEGGFGGTYIFYPRLEGIKRISVMSVGGQGKIAITKVVCVKDLVAQ